MTFDRKTYTDNIIEKLAYLGNCVKLYNSLNLTDINILSENFYRDFLNLIYGYTLVNINIEEPNAAAIDLGDEVNKISFQITSSAGLAKIKKTIKSFNDRDLHLKYNKLIVLNIVEKIKHQAQDLGDSSKLQINTIADVWDISNLNVDINDLSTSRLKEVSDFLEQEIRFKENNIVAKEVKTFLSLIEYLSDESQPSAGAGHFIEEPDPSGKINDRFANHATFLKTEFQNLYVEFGLVLQDVMKNADIGAAKVRRLGLHLKHDSDKVLNDKNGNAKDALEQLVSNYAQILVQNGVEYNDTAIRFFLVSQLIACNVFPNKVPVDA